MKHFISVLVYNFSQFLVKLILHAYDKGRVKLLRVTFIISIIRETFSCMEQYLWLKRCYKTCINLRVFFLSRNEFHVPLEQK